ncbi:hypothetical protein [Arsenicibacter rosenii]|uniref:PRTRC system protein B n=1 Tax=Arsenicibacter rosenii TaxID=1750698 RepID=A0A1S2VAV1_9BACT|nr:hypothetical protein [Arsenicibacter rosenii]OIN55854.1 hypothetical protein BLX24_27755 [Arsenicibacter rosenii]
MKLITEELTEIFLPVRALLLYERQSGSRQDKYYIESYTISDDGRPVNARPLTESEAISLGKSLYDSYAEKIAFLRPKGLLPKRVLYLHPSPEKGFAVWYTARQKRQMFFKESLTIPSGEACVPPMVWRADKRGLTIFALPADRKPSLKTRLCLAPFFNTGLHGGVCMGNVDVDVEKSSCLEEFITAWETCFYDSYFSHTLNDAMTKVNIVQLWQDQVKTGNPFPLEKLVTAKITLKDLLK